MKWYCSYLCWSKLFAFRFWSNTANKTTFCIRKPFLHLTVLYQTSLEIRHYHHGQLLMLLSLCLLCSWYYQSPDIYLYFFNVVFMIQMFLLSIMGLLIVHMKIYFLHNFKITCCQQMFLLYFQPRFPVLSLCNLLHCFLSVRIKCGQ